MNQKNAKQKLSSYHIVDIQDKSSQRQFQPYQLPDNTDMRQNSKMIYLNEIKTKHNKNIVNIEINNKIFKPNATEKQSNGQDKSHLVQIGNSSCETSSHHFSTDYYNRIPSASANRSIEKEPLTDRPPQFQTSHQRFRLRKNPAQQYDLIALGQRSIKSSIEITKPSIQTKTEIQQESTDQNRIKSRLSSIQDTSRRTWVHLPTNFHEKRQSQDIFSERAATQSTSRKQNREKIESLIVLNQLNKFVEKEASKPVIIYEEALQQIKDFSAQFKKIPNLAILFDNAIQLIVKEVQSLKGIIEITQQQCEVRCSEFKSQMEHAQIKVTMLENQLELQDLKTLSKKGLKELVDDFINGQDIVVDEEKKFNLKQLKSKGINSMTQFEEWVQRQVQKPENVKDLKKIEMILLEQRDVINQEEEIYNVLKYEQIENLKKMQNKTAIACVKNLFKKIESSETSSQTNDDFIDQIKIEYENQLKSQEFKMKQALYDVKMLRDIVIKKEDQVSYISSQKHQLAKDIDSLRFEQQEMREAMNQMQKTADSHNSAIQKEIQNKKDCEWLLYQATRNINDLNLLCKDFERKIEHKDNEIVNYKNQYIEIQDKLQESQLAVSQKEQEISSLKIENKGQKLVMKRLADTVSQPFEENKIIEVPKQQLAHFLSKAFVKAQNLLNQSSIHNSQKSVNTGKQSQKQTAKDTAINSNQNSQRKKKENSTNFESERNTRRKSQILESEQNNDQSQVYIDRKSTGRITTSYENSDRALRKEYQKVVRSVMAGEFQLNVEVKKTKQDLVVLEPQQKNLIQGDSDEEAIHFLEEKSQESSHQELSSDHQWLDDQLLDQEPLNAEETIEVDVQHEQPVQQSLEASAEDLSRLEPKLYVSPQHLRMKSPDSGPFTLWNTVQKHDSVFQSAIKLPENEQRAIQVLKRSKLFEAAMLCNICNAHLNQKESKLVLERLDLIDKIKGLIAEKNKLNQTGMVTQRVTDDLQQRLHQAQVQTSPGLTKKFTKKTLIDTNQLEGIIFQDFQAHETINIVKGRKDQWTQTEKVKKSESEKQKNKTDLVSQIQKKLKISHIPLVSTLPNK